MERKRERERRERKVYAGDKGGRGRVGGRWGGVRWREEEGQKGRDKDWQLTGADVDSLGTRMSKHSSSPAWGNYFQKNLISPSKGGFEKKGEKIGYKKVTVSFFQNTFSKK